MTKKLEELFDLPTAEDEDQNTADTAVEDVLPVELVPQTTTALSTLDKIEAALPAVRGLEASDAEMDELAGKAVSSYEELMTLGMNVDSRYSSEIFSVAGTMLGHAISAKTAKLNKKLAMVNAQLRKAKLEHDIQKSAEKAADGEPIQTAEGVVLDRNELMRRLRAGESEQTKH